MICSATLAFLLLIFFPFSKNSPIFDGSAFLQNTQRNGFKADRETMHSSWHGPLRIYDSELYSKNILANLGNGQTKQSPEKNSNFYLDSSERTTTDSQQSPLHIKNRFVGIKKSKKLLYLQQMSNDKFSLTKDPILNTSGRSEDIDHYLNDAPVVYRDKRQVSQSETSSPEHSSGSSGWTSMYKPNLNKDSLEAKYNENVNTNVSIETHAHTSSQREIIEETVESSSSSFLETPTTPVSNFDTNHFPPSDYPGSLATTLSKNASRKIVKARSTSNRKKPKRKRKKPKRKRLRNLDVHFEEESASAENENEHADDTLDTNGRNVTSPEPAGHTSGLPFVDAAPDESDTESITPEVFSEDTELASGEITTPRDVTATTFDNRTASSTRDTSGDNSPSSSTERTETGTSALSIANVSDKSNDVSTTTSGKNGSSPIDAAYNNAAALPDIADKPGESSLPPAILKSDEMTAPPDVPEATFDRGIATGILNASGKNITTTSSTDRIDAGRSSLDIANISGDRSNGSTAASGASGENISSPIDAPYNNSTAPTTIADKPGKTSSSPPIIPVSGKTTTSPDISEAILNNDIASSIPEGSGKNITTTLSTERTEAGTIALNIADISDKINILTTASEVSSGNSSPIDAAYTYNTVSPEIANEPVESSSLPLTERAYSEITTPSDVSQAIDSGITCTISGVSDENTSTSSTERSDAGNSSLDTAMSHERSDSLTATTKASGENSLPPTELLSGEISSPRDVSEATVDNGIESGTPETSGGNISTTKSTKPTDAGSASLNIADMSHEKKDVSTAASETSDGTISPLNAAYSVTSISPDIANVPGENNFLLTEHTSGGITTPSDVSETAFDKGIPFKLPDPSENIYTGTTSSTERTDAGTTTLDIAVISNERSDGSTTASESSGKNSSPLPVDAADSDTTVSPDIADDPDESNIITTLGVSNDNESSLSTSEPGTSTIAFEEKLSSKTRNTNKHKKKRIKNINVDIEDENESSDTAKDEVDETSDEDFTSFQQPAEREAGGQDKKYVTTGDVSQKAPSTTYVSNEATIVNHVSFSETSESTSTLSHDLLSKTSDAAFAVVRETPRSKTKKPKKKRLKTYNIHIEDEDESSQNDKEEMPITQTEQADRLRSTAHDTSGETYVSKSSTSSKDAISSSKSVSDRDQSDKTSDEAATSPATSPAEIEGNFSTILLHTSGEVGASEIPSATPKEDSSGRELKHKKPKKKRVKIYKIIIEDEHSTETGDEKADLKSGENIDLPPSEHVISDSTISPDMGDATWKIGVSSTPLGVPEKGRTSSKTKEKGPKNKHAENYNIETPGKVTPVDGGNVNVEKIDESGKLMSKQSKDSDGELGVTDKTHFSSSTPVVYSEEQFATQSSGGHSGSQTQKEDEGGDDSKSEVRKPNAEDNNSYESEESEENINVKIQHKQRNRGGSKIIQESQITMTPKNAENATVVRTESEPVSEESTESEKSEENINVKLQYKQRNRGDSKENQESQITTTPKNTENTPVVTTETESDSEESEEDYLIINIRKKDLKRGENEIYKQGYAEQTILPNSSPATTYTASDKDVEDSFESEESEEYLIINIKRQNDVGKENRMGKPAYPIQITMSEAPSTTSMPGTSEAGFSEEGPSVKGTEKDERPGRENVEEYESYENEDYYEDYLIINVKLKNEMGNPENRMTKPPDQATQSSSLSTSKSETSKPRRDVGRSDLGYRRRYNFKDYFRKTSEDANTENKNGRFENVVRSAMSSLRNTFSLF